jgi:hypothetical protein
MVFGVQSRQIQAKRSCLSHLPAWYAQQTSRKIDYAGCSPAPEVPPLDQARRARRPAPSAVEIDTLLTIASRVPDHGKLVPWRFIILRRWPVQSR